MLAGQGASPSHSPMGPPGRCAGPRARPPRGPSFMAKLQLHYSGTASGQASCPVFEQRRPARGHEALGSAVLEADPPGPARSAPVSSCRRRRLPSRAQRPASASASRPVARFDPSVSDSLSSVLTPWPIRIGPVGPMPYPAGPIPVLNHPQSTDTQREPSTFDQHPFDQYPFDQYPLRPTNHGWTTSDPSQRAGPANQPLVGIPFKASCKQHLVTRFDHEAWPFDRRLLFRSVPTDQHCTLD
jgi:hypothetical protein